MTITETRNESEYRLWQAQNADAVRAEVNRAAVSLLYLRGLEEDNINPPVNIKNHLKNGGFSASCTLSPQEIKVNGTDNLRRTMQKLGIFRQDYVSMCVKVAPRGRRSSFSIIIKPYFAEPALQVNGIPKLGIVLRSNGSCKIFDPLEKYRDRSEGCDFGGNLASKIIEVRNYFDLKSAQHRSDGIRLHIAKSLIGGADCFLGAVMERKNSSKK